MTSIIASFAINAPKWCVYYRLRGHEFIVLCFYVDDILIFGIKIDAITKVRSFMSKCFYTKDLDEAV